MQKFILAIALAATTIATATVQAAIIITPTSGVLNFTRWEINQNSTLTTSEVESITGAINPLTFEYKATPGGNDEGPLATSYDTTFNGDVSGGTTVYTSGAFVDGAEKYLLIKDGNENPSQYIFRISGFPFLWDGTEDIIMSGFWPEQGSISHIAIYDGGTPGGPDPRDIEPPAVPEPASLAIWSIGLIGLTLLRRRK